MKQTSISDYDKYKDICKQASMDDSCFENFRSHPEYMGILEHVSESTGHEYYDRIIKVNRASFDPVVVDILKKIDRFGNPKRFNYPVVGSISPTILRYFSILTDIHRMLGGLEGKTIVEVGAGYGGQSMMINLFHNVKKYVIVDLEEPISLIKKFLTVNGMDMSKYEFYSLNDLPYIDSDLFISNYAFSECYKPIQDVYIERLINRSEHLYMLCNFISKDLVYSKDELLERIKGEIQVSDESPITCNGNLLLFK